MHLNDLLDKKDVTLKELQAHLESVNGEERVRQATTTKRRHQKKLWELAVGGEKLSMEDLVAKDAKPLEPVPFEGWNNQPIYRPFKKVFYRTGDGRIAGYNESPAAWFAGPGYYVMNQDKDGLFVDYTQIPTEKPTGWPEIVTNEKGISRFIYGFMHDYLRRVHRKIIIGRAFRHGKASPNYFILARPE